MEDDVASGWGVPAVVISLMVALWAVSWSTNPWWFRVGGSLVVIAALLVFIVRNHRAAKVLERLSHDGRCTCGYDLRGTPPIESSRHRFDVWGRMVSTRKTVICPECGSRQVVWEHD